jgi:uncharacterized membrane protein
MSYNFANNHTSFNKPSTFGLSPNAAAVISYIWIPVTSAIVLVTEKENRMVRFHAFQALFMGLAVFAATLVLSLVIGVLTFVKAYRGEMYKLPAVGNYAAKMAGN